MDDINKKCCFATRIKNCFRQRRGKRKNIALSSMKCACKIKVCKITGDRKLCGRMAALGLYPGSEAEIICPEHGGQCIVKIHGGKICLDRELTDNIIVTGA